MQALRIAQITFALLFGWAAPATGDAFTVDDWSLAVVVDDSSSGEHEVQGFSTVQNPFQNSHAVSVGDSMAEASYDFGWTAEYGSFAIEAAHQAEGVPSLILSSRSAGSIYITPTVDLSLSIEAAYTYQLPAYPMMSRLIVSVSHEDGPPMLFHDSQQALTMPGNPTSGTFSTQGDIIMPAGETWVMRYSMELHTWGDTTGYLATGSGFVNFQITPEPGTATLLLLPAAVLICRRRTARQRRGRQLDDPYVGRDGSDCGA